MKELWTGAGLGALLALAAAGCRADAAPQVPPSLRGVRTIVTLGDSITQGGGQPGGYVWLMEKWLRALYPDQGIQIVNAGISGHRSTDMEARFARDVLERRPDLVTISVGVNDVWHAFRDFRAGVDHPRGDLPNGVPLEVYRQKVEAMVRAARQAGIRVVLLSPTLIHEDLLRPENARVRIYAAAMRRIAADNGALFVDLYRAFAEPVAAYRRHAGPGMNLLTTDGVHLNAAGNHLMAFVILRSLGVPEPDLRRVSAEAGPRQAAAPNRLPHAPRDTRPGGA